MALTGDTYKRLARILVEAEVSGKALAEPPSEFLTLTLTDAYMVQAEAARLREGSGEAQIGWKTMGTNPAIRSRSGGLMTEPARGYLFESAPVQGRLTIPSGMNALAEPEVTFVLGKDLGGPGVSAEDAVAATKEICASIEVAWTRFEEQPHAFALIADNAGAARVVLSSQRVTVDEVGGLAALAGLTVEFQKNGETVQTGSGVDVHGNPGNAVAWVANHLAQHGLGLKAGQVILAGSLTLPTPIQPGDVVTARFDKLGDVTVRLAAPGSAS